MSARLRAWRDDWSAIAQDTYGLVGDLLRQRREARLVAYALWHLEGNEVVYIHPDGESQAVAAIVTVDNVKEGVGWAHDHLEGGSLSPHELRRQVLSRYRESRRARRAQRCNNNDGG